MERRAINPWKWQDNFGFQQANEVKGAQRTLICSGQTSVDGNGTPVHAGDMAAQVNQALDNVEAVLKEAGMDKSNIVKLNIYTTDIPALFAAFPTFLERTAGLQFASTWLGVAGLALPELMIELEATAVA
ncbi:MAG: RidA family protein [Chloroflexota bacterium]|nr:RidA family protein [Chloroflexota bacterium]